jgi:plasmid replication initiation protein
MELNRQPAGSRIPDAWSTSDQFSWINEWEECTTREGRVEGMEFVLPDWFYRGVIDRSLVLTIDPAYFRLTGGIERWLYRVARKHAGRQKQGWLFDIPHLHAKSGSLAKVADFAFDTVIARETAETLADHDPPVLTSTIGQRVTFANAAQTGRLVFESAEHGPAAREIAALAAEVGRIAP